MRVDAYEDKKNDVKGSHHYERDTASVVGEGVGACLGEARELISFRG